MRISPPPSPRFGELTGEDVDSWPGYLAAHRKRRADFRAAGATATDHGHPTALTADLAQAEKEALFAPDRRRRLVARATPSCSGRRC